MQTYIEENNVPRNKLLSQGYRSVGDWHSTSKVEEGQDERGGRWAGKEKTECGLHKDYFKMRQAQAKLEGMQIVFFFLVLCSGELMLSFVTQGVVSA